MPHLIIEYSSNIEDQIDLPGLIEELHTTAVSTGVFPLGGIRTRAARRSDYRIADGDPENGFVFLTVRYGAGRTIETLKAAGETIFDALCARLTDLYDSIPLSLGMEMQQIDPELSFKKNNIHQRLARKEGS
jgi:5-carboxymethyl-2-hydroxymuconate isomerase